MEGIHIWILIVVLIVLNISDVHSSKESCSMKEKPERARGGLSHLDELALFFTVMVRIKLWLAQTPAIGKYVVHQWAIDYFWTGALGDHCSPQHRQPRYSQTVCTHRKQCAIHVGFKSWATILNIKLTNCSLSDACWLQQNALMALDDTIRSQYEEVPTIWRIYIY